MPVVPDEEETRRTSLMSQVMCIASGGVGVAASPHASTVSDGERLALDRAGQTLCPDQLVALAGVVGEPQQDLGVVQCPLHDGQGHADALDGARSTLSSN